MSQMDDSKICGGEEAAILRSRPYFPARSAEIKEGIVRVRKIEDEGS